MYQQERPPEEKKSSARLETKRMNVSRLNDFYSNLHEAENCWWLWRFNQESGIAYYQVFLQLFHAKPKKFLKEKKFSPQM